MKKEQKKLIFIIGIVLVIVISLIILSMRDTKQIQDYDKLEEVIKYTKNHNSLFKSCMDKGATPETGMITINGLALYCAEKIGDFELLRLFEKLKN